ncbi:MAG: hypothetical protein COT88_00795 [Candidatus Colwellbacteria bacterium CG10_big_fil_rev_8_21_14_0_10_41_28]|uniref:Ig-like domain-containing protein n=1 Tax=Candidatus Colwellbacteria bacterium CG10_big_fil_rev_8_21_14_0_10_41_28 TaxID=1974539 RepID=A0A2H0VJU4_9BACT|nr:MAG: hypothetical protein COT88_00795 [Candidatus Colwellbacteria bacterium CG10_big_fil_rev_8_21_14_0_10_41_28]
MTKAIKKLGRNTALGFLTVAVLSGYAMPFIAPTAFAADFNGGSQPYATLRVSNYTENPNCDSCWNDNAVGAGVGDTISLGVFVHNTSSELAEDVTVSIDSDVSSGEIRFDVEIKADNASTITDSVKVNITDGDAQDIDHVTTIVRDGFGNSKSFTGDVLSSSGINIGNVNAGLSNSRIVVVRIDIKGDSDNNGGGEDKPGVTTLPATNIEDDRATLRCDVDANGDDTDVWFEWGDYDNQLDEDTNDVRVDADESNKRVEIEINGLDSDNRYYFRCVAENSEGTTRGSVRDFRTDNGDDNNDGNLSATTLSATNIDKDSAKLRCDVDTEDADADVWFEYSKGDKDLNEDTKKVSVNDNETDERVETSIDDLDEDSRYYFRCVVEDDDNNIDRGTTRDFRTSDTGNTNGNEPTVVTLSPSNVTSNSATLRGSVDPNDDDTEAWFEWGVVSSNLNRDTSKQDMGSGDRSIDFDTRVSGLTAGVTYYYRAVAESSEGIDRGVVKSFTVSSGTTTNVVTRFIDIFRTVEVEEEPQDEALIVILDSDTLNFSDRDREVRYIVSYENRTDNTLTDALLRVDVPRELEFLDADPNPDDESRGQLVFEIGTIRPGEQDEFVIDTALESSVDDNDEIVFVAQIEYKDSDSIDKKIVRVIDNSRYGDKANGGAFTALVADSLRGFFGNPIFWLILLALLIYFTIRYVTASRDKRSEALV